MNKQEFILRSILSSGILTRASDPLTDISAEAADLIKRAETCYRLATQRQPRQGRDKAVYPAVKVNMPDLISDKTFRDWLNAPETRAWTWHEKGSEIAEFSDVIVWVEASGEGSEQGDMPDHVWERIVSCMDGRAGLCWITFLGG